MRYYERRRVMDEMAKMDTTNIDANQMMLVLQQCEVDNEPPVYLFQGFNGEYMALKITPDCGEKKHDHLELWHNGEYLGYLHIDLKGVYFWKEGRHVKLQFKDVGAKAYD